MGFLNVLRIVDPVDELRRGASWKSKLKQLMRGKEPGHCRTKLIRAVSYDIALAGMSLNDGRGTSGFSPIGVHIGHATYDAQYGNGS
jgi:hypothetical protein